MNLKEKAKTLKLDIPALCIAMKRSDTPITAKILAGMTVGYALSPIDLIPDFIPVLGLLDDLIILPLLIMLTVKMIPQEILDECRISAMDLWNNGRPKKWRYAIPVVIFWFLLIRWIVSRFLC